MGEIEKARNLLNKIIRDVANSAPKFYAQIEQIETTKSELNKLKDEEQNLGDRICKEREISSNYANLFKYQEEARNENFRRYEESIEFFRREVLKNAKYALASDERPLVYKISGGRGISPLICSARDKSLIIKKKAEITKKIHHLRHLHQNIFCLSQDFDENLSNSFFHYQINQEIDFSDYKMENFSKPIKEKLMEQPIPDCNFLTMNSITSLSNAFSNSPSFSPNNDKSAAISLSTFSFPRSPSIEKKDLSDYYTNFSKLISPTLQELIGTIEDLLKEMNTIFRIENSTIKTSTENFFRSNPSFIHTASVSCSNIIFEAQENIHKAQKIAFLLNQNILPPETKVLNESHHIQTLLNELVSIFDNVYDRLSRSQIISQNMISFDFNSPDIQIDELSRAQIERCNLIVSELKTIFEQSLTVNSSFLGVLNDIIVRSRENQSIRSKLDINIKTPPPKEIDDSQIKQKFLQLKQRILKKQSEQLNAFCNTLEEIPPEVKEIQLKKEINIENQANQSPGLHFPSNNTSEQLKTTETVHNGVTENPLTELKRNLQQMKSNPYQDSNRNLLEKIIERSKEPSEIITITAQKQNNSKHDDSSSGEQVNDDHSTSSKSDNYNKYYQVIENMKNDLSSAIITDDVETLMKQRDYLIEELRQRTEKFNISQFQKNEKMKIKMSKRDLIETKKEERDKLKNQLEESESKLQDISDSLNEVKEEISQLEKEKSELESQQRRIIILKSKYEKYSKLLNEVKDAEQNFDEITNEKK